MEVQKDDILRTVEEKVDEVVKEEEDDDDDDDDVEEDGTHGSEWDAERGIWKGSMAATIQSIDDLPDPLYIFGYGSLLWRPGDLLEQYPSYPATCLGYSRFFAQRSTDHRGTSQYPGLVANLISNQYLVKNNIHIQLDECVGRIFLIPSHDIERIIAELDYREKGGYHRHTIQVRLLEATPHHEVNTIQAAVVYRGSRKNPNFDLITHDNWIDEVSTLIATAIGPSGRNAEYCLNLSTYVQVNGHIDKYLFEIDKLVRMKACTWFVQRLMQTRESLLFHLYQNINDSIPTASQEVCVVGWGSNEYCQIQYPAEKEQILTLNKNMVIENIFRVAPYVNFESELSTWMLPPQVKCGTSHSGLLFNKSLYIWGHNNKYQISHLDDCKGRQHSTVSDSEGEVVMMSYREIQNVIDFSLGYEFTLVLLTSGEVMTIGNHERYADSGCQKTIVHVVAGVNNSAYLTEEGSVVMLGSNAHGHTLQKEWFPSPYLLDPVVKPVVVGIACGVKHTLLLDSVGRVWSLGNNQYGQLGRESSVSNDNTPHIVDFTEDLRNVRWSFVMCGWSHNIVEGATARGHKMFACWGRNDMHQLSNDTVKFIYSPQIVSPPQESPTDIVNMWAGSEFTLCSNGSGILWGRGWTEHGNVTLSFKKKYVDNWIPIVNSEERQLKLKYNWRGGLSAGGAQCLAIV